MDSKEKVVKLKTGDAKERSPTAWGLKDFLLQDH